MSLRVIPRLDIKGPNLVKGIHLEGLRVIGKPEEFARHYYEQGADELLYVDIVASLYGRNSLLDIVERTAREIFIPLTVGGGIRTIEDVRAALRAGADKVALNTAAVRNPDLVREAAKRFGSSTIVVSIEAYRKPDGTYEPYTDNGRERTRLDVFEWAQRVEELGAGEILLTSIEREGTGKGMDLPLIRRVAESVSIPVVASGGAGKVDHVVEAAVEGKADAVAVASVFHYERVQAALAGASPPGAREILGQRPSSKIEPATIPRVKAALRARGVDCREPVPEAAHA
jgi:cyclase